MEERRNKWYSNEEMKESGKTQSSISIVKTNRDTGITLVALVITIVLNSSYLAMERMNKIEKI